MIRLEFYGVLTDVAGRSAMAYPLAEGDTVAALLARLGSELPQLRRHLPTVACAVDDAIVSRSHPLRPGATLALLPPVSGG